VASHPPLSYDFLDTKRLCKVWDELFGVSGIPCPRRPGQGLAEGTTGERKLSTITAGGNE
jgi:hypothetical protein